MNRKLAFLAVTASFAVAPFVAGAQGSPLPDRSDPFWGVMSNLDRPDDPDCPTEAKNLLDTLGLPYDTTERANATCASIAQIVTSMETSFASEGMETNLFTDDDWHAVENLYFDDSEGRIEFTRDIDFMSYDFMNFLSMLTEQLDIDTANIELDADVVGGLEGYGAILTMRNLPDFDEPGIEVDGEEDEEGVVSGLTYDAAGDTLTFNAAHFTKFTAKEKSEIGGKKPKIDSVKVLRYMTPFGADRVKVTVKGKHFDKKSEVTFGGREANKTKYKSSKKIVGYFSAGKLAKSGKSELKVRVINSGGASKKYHKEVTWTKSTE